MKKILKNNIKIILAVIVSILATGGIVYAATTANQISYTRSGTGIANVEQALNDLYARNTSKKNVELIGDYQLDSTNVFTYTKTFNLADREDYNSLQSSDFYVVIESIAPAGGGSNSNTEFEQIGKNYDSNTGVLTLTVPQKSLNGYRTLVKRFGIFDKIINKRGENCSEETKDNNRNNFRSSINKWNKCLCNIHIFSVRCGIYKDKWLKD